MKEYLQIDGDLAGELDQQYESLSTEQVEMAVDVMQQRYGSDVIVSPEDVDLDEVYEGAVEIDIEGVRESPIYADPNAEEGRDHLCVKWGNLGNDDNPPEGRAKDGSGDDLFGIR